MKKFYNEPQLWLLQLANADVLTASSEAGAVVSKQDLGCADDESFGDAKIDWSDWFN